MALVIVTHIWQKLSSVEREVTFIVTDFWQLLSQIFGETSLIVTNIWRNRTCTIFIWRIFPCSQKALQWMLKHSERS
jgi:hypothetical protein